MNREIGERLDKLIKTKQIQSQDFAEKINVGNTTVSNWTTGSTAIPLKHIYAIHKHFPELNLNWLISGTGDMFIKAEDSLSFVSESTEVYRKHDCKNCFRLQVMIDSLKEQKEEKDNKIDSLYRELGCKTGNSETAKKNKAV